MDLPLTQTTIDAVSLELAQAAAADVRLLCRLNDREADAALIHDLKSKPVADWFALYNDSAEMVTGCKLLANALDGMFDPPSQDVLDDLSSDFTNIFLTFGMRVSPTESYWLTEDHLERQAPMFAVRDWYKHYGLSTEDWKLRPDDHIILEMQFVAALLETATMPSLSDAGRFLDQHLLVWSRELFGGIAARAATPFYAGLALVSEAQLQVVRNVLVVLTDEPRATLSMDQAVKMNSTPEDPQTSRFMPGLAPSW